MANRRVGLYPTWAHLPTPAPAHAAATHYCSSPAWAALLNPAAAFENEALTSALRASMAPAPAHAAYAPTFSSPPATPSSSTSSASDLLSSGAGHDAPAPPASSSRPPAGLLPARAHARTGPKGGRVSKRKPRPSRRAQTTYITADPADFRRMVQEITGLPVPGAGPSPSSSSSFPSAASTVAAPSWAPAPACVLPTLDTSAFLLDRAAPAPEDRSPASGGYAPAAVAAAGQGEDDPSVLMELEALVRAPAADACGFPTLDLDSWGII